MDMNLGNGCSLTSVDAQELSRIAGGWCGTPVPGALPPIPGPGPDPWFNQLGELGKYGSLAGMQRVLVR